MTSDAMWAYGLLIAIGYGFYRLIKWGINTHKAMNEKMRHAARRCEHVDEPNHDRIACYLKQTSMAQSGISGFIIVMLLIAGPAR